MFGIARSIGVIAIGSLVNACSPSERADGAAATGGSAATAGSGGLAAGGTGGNAASGGSAGGGATAGAGAGGTAGGGAAPNNIGAYALISDTDARTLVDVALPAYNEASPTDTSFVDPTFGTRIIRVTGDPGATFLGGQARWRSDKPYTTPLYPLYPAWNANQTRFHVQFGAEIVSTGQVAQAICDGATYVPLAVFPSIKTEYRWHPSDPKLMVWVDSNGFAGTFDVDSVEYTTRFSNPPSGFSSGSMGQAEGNPSDDGRYVNIQGVIGGEDVVFVANLETGQASAVFTASQLGYASMDGSKMSRSGQYILVASVWGMPTQVIRWSDGKVMSTRNYVGHHDIGYDFEGQEVSYIPGQAAAWRILDGTDIPLSGPTRDSYHASCRNLAVDGWGYADFEPPGPMGGELFAIELRPGGAIRRICPTRASYSSYDHTGWGVPSPDGLRMSFRSDWGNSTGPTYGFVVDVREVPLQ
jgi:hypothetical protein